MARVIARSSGEYHAGQDAHAGGFEQLEPIGTGLSEGMNDRLKHLLARRRKRHPMKRRPALLDACAFSSEEGIK